MICVLSEKTSKEPTSGTDVINFVGILFKFEVNATHVDDVYIGLVVCLKVLLLAKKSTEDAF